jgi:hypothetical protein
VYKSDNMVIGIPKDKKTIRGDGNCFFRSISFALTGNEDHHLEVRKCVVEHILFLGDKIKSFLQANHTAKSYNQLPYYLTYTQDMMWNVLLVL